MLPHLPLGSRTMIGGSQAPMTRRSREPAHWRRRKARQRWCSPMSPMPASSCHATCHLNRKLTVVAELWRWRPRALPSKPFINIALGYRCLNLSAGEGR
jgi:hypothetical protein